MTQELTIWNDKNQLQEIKNIYGKDLTDNEFSVFLGIGKATGLNPFLREIWAVKYGDKAASIFIGRDGYRKAAQASPLYDWHFIDSIYSNDRFSIISGGEIRHDYAEGDRGELIGAYGLCQRKGSSRPNFTKVIFDEYYAGNKNVDGSIKKGKYGDMKPTLWDTKPETMIKKVAEAQVLRMTFQDLFAGTYDESEQWEENPNKEKLKVDAPRKVIEAPKKEPEQEPEPEEISPEDLFDSYYSQLTVVENMEELTILWREVYLDRDYVARYKELESLKDDMKLSLASKEPEEGATDESPKEKAKSAQIDEDDKTFVEKPKKSVAKSSATVEDAEDVFTP